jgi:hypothetical protein
VLQEARGDADAMAGGHGSGVEDGIGLPQQQGDFHLFRHDCIGRFAGGRLHDRDYFEASHVETSYRTSTTFF